MPDRSATGSCARCGDALNLASLKRGGFWYCRPACAAQDEESAFPPPGVAEVALINRPRRAHRRREPKELRRP